MQSPTFIDLFIYLVAYFSAVSMEKAGLIFFKQGNEVNDSCPAIASTMQCLKIMYDSLSNI